jgi:hypothetical protein
MAQQPIQIHPQFRVVRPIPITQLQQIQKEQPTFEAPPQEQKVEPVHRPAPEMRFLRQFELPSPIREILPFLNSIIQGDLQKEIQEQKEESQKSLSEMSSDYNSNESDSEASDESDFPVKPEKNLSFMTEQVQQNNQDEQPKVALPLGRTAYGRSLILNPIRIPVPMTESTVMQEPERAHYVHPRSI